MTKGLLLTLSLSTAFLCAQTAPQTAQPDQTATDETSISGALHALGSAFKKSAQKVAASTKKATQRATATLAKVAKSSAHATKDALAQTGLAARATAEKVFAPIKLKRRFDALKARAERGDTTAQMATSEMYAKGWGTVQDFAQAIHWLTVAADAGNSQAQYLLGRAYQTGSIVAADSATAGVWLEKAAQQGHRGAQKMLRLTHATVTTLHPL